MPNYKVIITQTVLEERVVEVGNADNEAQAEEIVNEMIEFSFSGPKRCLDRKIKIEEIKEEANIS
jgi:hypothetical protein